MRNSVNKTLISVLGSLAVVLALTGCGGSGGDSSSAASADLSKTASLSWNAPATRVNGEGLAMGELQGYVILYGREANNLDRRIVINDASTMDYLVSNLDNGEWFFAIQVVDVDGLVSSPSKVVSKFI